MKAYKFLQKAAENEIQRAVQNSKFSLSLHCTAFSNILPELKNLHFSHAVFAKKNDFLVQPN